MSSSSPSVSLNDAFGTNASNHPRLEQIEQLHDTTLPSSSATSYRTFLQWHPPMYVFIITLVYQCILFVHTVY